MTRRSATVRRLATAGFVAVLLVLTAGAIGGVLNLKVVSDRFEQSHELSDWYGDARDDVAREDFWATEYLLQLIPNGEPLDPAELRREHARAAGALTRALELVRRDGTPADRRLAERILGKHRTYLASTHRLFAAVDRRDTRGAFVIELGEIDGTFSSIEDGINQAAASHERLAHANFQKLRRADEFLVAGTLIAFALGLLCLTGFWAILRRYRRRADAAIQAELVALERSEAKVQRALEEVQTLSDRQDLILNSAGEGICALDSDGRATLVNAAAAKMTGHTAEALVGHRFYELVQDTREDGTVLQRQDGTTFPVEFTATPILRDGRPSGAVVVFKDISERREVERAKDEFTSVVSHELRTPLTSIRGSLGLLESGVLGPLPEKGQRMVEIAVQNTDRLVRLINDILDIERIDSGKVDMHPEACDGAELIARAVDVMGPVAADARVTLTVDAPPAALFADPDRVLQALTNLMSNAVKFSPAGSAVRVSCGRRDDELVFAVRDEGRGIPAEKLVSIFERFQQVDASDSREKGGTGLGLAICRTIAEHHGGRIWVESELGAGSTFSFALPAPTAVDSPRPGRVPGGPTILVCDDDASVVEVVGAMLEQRGYRVIPAHSGEQALLRARAERPDAILLDLLMPGMSGWETAAALQQHPETRGVPILILSVFAPDDVEAPPTPVLDWIEKPLEEAALFLALERAVNPREHPFRVLIVEDDRDQAAVLTEILERHGIETFHARDGREAIELSQRVLPDLLVLDLGLPEADGFQVVDWLRRHDRLSSLPLVVYTARELDEADRERLRLGTSTEFLTKGRITPHDFEQRVVDLLARLTRDRTPEVSDDPEAHPVGR
ncbi:MAG: hypothetical protein QOI64_2561 [Solirubrobacteraceae bacterium]|nr:hypothetical protein [Solirubrobacteraceae bacterium]